ncbi:MAG TPA: UMP kinase [Candidatus Marinimicrobia bacterium]|nr:UMP kinase [Candidatus Neomarinimicrobiota bacterium]HRS52460.1 UMP kinase [Candidatus Neomarinimicrobiota bacterium]HRU92411.1 UMP kinase [Candidatus Neomarinimicrobiota bacterium]
MVSIPYKRVILKFSGEALAGEKGANFDPDIIRQIAVEIKSAADLGVQMGIVFGGGNIIRGLSGVGKSLDRVQADYMGMLATVINALAMQDALEKLGLKAHVFSAIQMIEVAELMIIRNARKYLDRGEIVIFSAGTGRPFFSTDSGAALRAVEVQAEAIIKATKVDGVYDKDPEKFNDAQFYDQLDYQTVIEKRLKVMDLTAITICQDNNLPIIVYNMKTPGNLHKILTGEKIGTLISRSQL